MQQARCAVQRSTPRDSMPEELAGRRPPPLRALSWNWTAVEAVVLLLLLLPHHGATELIGGVEGLVLVRRGRWMRLVG
jgi:hypothetical protein